jgi:antitoxin ParD1/3/4
MASSFVIGDHFEKFIDGLVESGQYASRSEVVREALATIELREKQRQAALQEFEAFVQEGIDSGDYMPMDEVFDALDAELEEQSKAAAE